MKSNLLLKRICADIYCIIAPTVICFVCILMFKKGFQEFSENGISLFVAFFCILKIGYFFIYSLEIITRRALKEHFKQTTFVVYFFYIIMLIQFSFSLDYFSLQILNSESFFGMRTSLKGIIDSFYFSSISFATIGYGDIKPNTSIAKFLVTIESFSTILFLVVILSNSGNFVDQFKNNGSKYGDLPELDAEK